jgi:GDPmannose 4,6-dehydratase
MKSVVITGVTGQDGAYLTEQMLCLGYHVFGTFRRTSSVNFWRLKELGVADHPNLKLIDFDLTDTGSCHRLLERAEPESVFNLAAQSYVGVSFDQPIATAMMSGIGPLHLLEAIRSVNPKIKFYQASSSELYGRAQTFPQNELTPFYPRSPYAVAKLFAHWTTVNYRESYGLFASSGILFNHESPLRGQDFVTRRITNTVARIALGKEDCLHLGNLDAQRDWGFAKEYTEGMRLMLEHAEPDTFVLATGRTYPVRCFVELAFAALGVVIEWRGSGVEEVGIDGASGAVRVRINPAFFRPAEVDLLIGDASKARKVLGWEARMGIEELSRIMVEADLRRNRDGYSF